MLSLSINGHRFVVAFDDEGAAAALEVILRFAADPELPFDPHDAKEMGASILRLYQAAREARAE